MPSIVQDKCLLEHLDSIALLEFCFTGWTLGEGRFTSHILLFSVFFIFTNFTVHKYVSFLLFTQLKAMLIGDFSLIGLDHGYILRLCKVF